MPQTGGQYPPRPMPQQQPSGYQSNPGYPGSWNQPTGGWHAAQPPYGPASQTVTATPPAVDGTRKRRSGALVAAALVLALGAGLGGGYLGADLRQGANGTAITASSISHALTQSAAPTSHRRRRQRPVRRRGRAAERRLRGRHLLDLRR